MIAATLLALTATIAPGDDAPATWWDASIAPFLERHCTSCHGETKRKGGLALHTFDELAAGGRGGPVFAAGDADASALVARMRLDLADDDHMPPPDVDQPSAEAIADVAAWIAAGARLDLAAPTDLPTPAAEASATDAPAPIDAPFPHAAVDALRAALGHVEIVDPERRGLWVDLRARPATNDADIDALVAPLGPFVVELSLARTAVTDTALTAVARLPNLERLDVAHTAVTSRGLEPLRDHAALRALVATDTAVDDAALGVVASLPRLERLAVWRTPWSADATRVLAARRPTVRVIDAAPLAPEPLEVEPPPSFSRLPELPAVNDACPVSGAPVDPRYRIAHDGRIVGFCCPNCAVTFWEAPGDHPVEETAAAGTP